MALRTATTTGNWSSTTTWGGAAVPGAGDTVSIPTGVVVSVTDARTVGASGPGAPENKPTVNATGGGSTGGSLAAGNYYAAFSYVNANGESGLSPVSDQFAVAAGNIPRVTMPALPTGVVSASIYLSTTDGARSSLTRQATGVTGTTYDLSAAYAAGAAPNPAITIARTGTLKIDGGSLRVRGDVRITGTGAAWDAIWLLNGGTWRWDATAATNPTITNYRQITDDWFIYGTFRADGTVGTRCTVTSDLTGAAGAGRFDPTNNSGSLASGVWNCSYTDFTDLGTAVLKAFRLSGNTTGLHFDHCLLDRCGQFLVTENVSPAAEFSWTNGRLRNSLDLIPNGGDGFGMRVFFVGTPTATRSINGSKFESSASPNAVRPDFLVSHELTYNDCFFENSLNHGGTLAVPATGVVIGYKDDTSTHYHTLKDIYFYNVSETNPHYIALNGSMGDALIDGVVIEQLGGTDADGDFLQDLASPASARTITLQNVIMLPNAVGKSSGNLVNGLGAPNTTTKVKHCTVHLGGGGGTSASAGVSTGEALGGIYYGEHPSGGGLAAALADVIDNLFWDTVRRDAMIGANALVGAVDVITPSLVHHNARYNALLLSKSTVNSIANTTTPGIQAAKLSTQAAYTGDLVDVDPQFVDGMRGLAKWDHSLAATESRAISSLTSSAGTHTSYPTITTIATVVSTAHGLARGDWVTIGGASVAGYNVTARVLSVADTNTFTYGIAGSVASSATGATITKRGRVSNAIAFLKLLSTDAGYDSRYTPAAFLTYIRAGFVPTNAAYDGAASDGGDLGAVAYAAGGGGGTAALIYTTQPGGTASGGLLSPQPVLAWQISGVTQTGMTTSATVTLVTVSGGPGTLGGTTTKAAVAGVVTFTDLTVSGSGVYKLSAA